MRHTSAYQFFWRYFCRKFNKEEVHQYVKIYNLAEHFYQISVHMMKNISLNCCNRKLCLVFNLYSTESLIPIISVETITARKPGRSLLLTIILKANKLLYILFSCYMLKFVIPFLH